MNRPAAAAIAALLLAGSAGLASAQMPAMPPPVTDPAMALGGHYVLDAHHGTMILRVRHMGLARSTFRMDKVQAGYDFDPARPDAAKVSATIDANSFDQGDPGISAQFAKEFLDAPNHPTITFTSTALHRTGPNTGTMTGDLTLAGVTKPVTLDVKFDGFRPGGAMGPARMGFSATGVVNRADFNVGPQIPVAIVGNVDVELEMEFVKAP